MEEAEEFVEMRLYNSGSMGIELEGERSGRGSGGHCADLGWPGGEFLLVVGLESDLKGRVQSATRDITRLGSCVEDEGNQCRKS